MRLVDSNVLLHAVDSAVHDHPASRTWLDSPNAIVLHPGPAHLGVLGGSLGGVLVGEHPS